MALKRVPSFERSPLQHAVSIAGLMLTKEAMINNLSACDSSLYNPSKMAKLIGATCATTYPCSAANRLGLDPVTGKTVSAALIGPYVPDSGVPYQGTRIHHTTASDGWRFQERGRDR
jgi:hypothetical protein